MNIFIFTNSERVEIQNKFHGLLKDSLVVIYTFMSQFLIIEINTNQVHITHHTQKINLEEKYKLFRFKNRNIDLF